MAESNPILNNPYEEPARHYATNPEGELDYECIVHGRRLFTGQVAAMPVTTGPQKEFLSVSDDLTRAYGSKLVNLIRKEISVWRQQGHPNVTRVTASLLRFWFLNPERHAIECLFFAQREAIETAIWLNEVADKSNAGTNILRKLAEARGTIGSNLDDQLPRIAFKMATGTGKTVVMAALILYHFFNRQDYPADTRFADNFLVVAPGVTIRDRLSVLRVETNRDALEADYYTQRRLVPRDLLPRLPLLNAKLVIANYHQFEPRQLSGNKRGALDGKLGADGRKQEPKEDFSLVLRRLMPSFKAGTRLLVLNDEAHHCYLPKSGDKKKAEGEDTNTENERAAVWFSGLRELHRRFKVRSVYDLSATPYYLTGSGHEPYSLFPWVVSDFGLIDAIESGLVKIPYLPTRDDTQSLELPVLRNLYHHVKDDLPKAGVTRQRKRAKEKGEELKEAPPKLPDLVQQALDQFYKHYEEEYKNRTHTAGARGEAQLSLDDTPPVFIVVCNNTGVSREVYKFIAGYEWTDADGETHIIPGRYDLFSNYDPATRAAKNKPPALLIDSDALEHSGQIDASFRKIFAPEIAQFRREIAIRRGQGAAEAIGEAEILREVVNTVGKRNALGSHIRCVVSVSMLSERQRPQISVLIRETVAAGLLKPKDPENRSTKFGEPDIGVSEAGVSEDGKKQVQVEIRGLDIYDPIKDEVKSRAAHDIAYWMVDDDYDGTNFVVRQVFFCGGKKDEFQKWRKGLDNLVKASTKKRAEKTLRIEIDEEAFDRLYGTVSHPVRIMRDGQKIAVRVVSQFGEETTKVLEV